MVYVAMDDPLRVSFSPVAFSLPGCAETAPAVRASVKVIVSLIFGMLVAGHGKRKRFDRCDSVEPCSKVVIIPGCHSH